jgi:phosphotransferase system  glucose/maltose/N-acetylglucosamine-specific IIC component
MSFGAGVAMMTALQLFLRANAPWMMFARLALLLCVAIGITAVRFRKTIS